MESVIDVHYKQCAVIEFLVTEKESVGNIHKCLCNVHGSAMVDRSTAGHWVKRVSAFETGKAELHNLPRSGCPVTAVSPKML
jgi:squalene cyclase